LQLSPLKVQFFLYLIQGWHVEKILVSFFILFTSLTFAQTNIVVSIAPEKTFVEKIAKDRVAVTVMVETGSSPHSYETKASQMIAISKADIYLSIGVGFEDVWLERFKSQNPELSFVNISDNVQKNKILEHQHEDGKREDEHNHKGLDPHTWTSPTNVAIMAQNIYTALVKLEPKNGSFYKANLDTFLKEIEETDKDIKKILHAMKPNSKFMVFHPSWGYFAKAYNLEQVAVEVEGKSPKPQEMITVIKEAKEEKVKVIFTQPEFSDKSAQIISKETGVRVKKISPLSPEWSQNLINMAKEIAEN